MRNTPAQQLADRLLMEIDNPHLDEALTLIAGTKIAGTLALSADARRQPRRPKTFPPEIRKLLDQHIASTDHPPRHMDYLNANAALKKAYTTESNRSRVLDREAFLGALQYWCDEVGYLMPKTPAEKAVANE